MLHKAKGCKMLDQWILLAIKGKYSIVIFFIIPWYELDPFFFTYAAHINYYYPVSSGSERNAWWDKIVCINLNNKCRGCRKKIKEAQLQKKGGAANESDNSITEKLL